MPRASAAAISRHPHLAEVCPANRIRVDLHSHTMWSGDSTTTPDEIAGSVAAAGLDVLCITDHHAVDGAKRLADELDCRVIIGEEVRTTAGELIGLFVDQRVPNGMSPAATATAIREQGGIVYVPHPFDPFRRNLRREALDELVAAGLIDAIEGLNAKTSLAHLNTAAVEYARDAGLALGAGSDAHVPDALGAAYVEMATFDGPATFLEALRGARLVGHHWDEPRPWSPRIVPSVGSR